MRCAERLRCVLLSAIALGGWAVAHAQGEAASRLIERMYRVAPAIAAAPAATIDTTPPVLAVLDAGTTWSMNRGAVPLSVLVKATDDQSGLSHIFVQAVGPSGQGLVSMGVFDYPVLSVSRRVPLNSFFDGRLLEPGTWNIVYARLVDVAGNHLKVSGSALTGLGNTQFTVVNAGSYDNVAPTLTGGQLLTPVVALSGAAKGTTQAPFIGIKLSAADTGATGVAGIAAIGLAFCLADESRCLDVIQTTPLGGNGASATVTIGRQVSTVLGDAPGDYFLYEVDLIDHAGNWRSLLSTAFGGTTDFGALISGGTKIQLKP